jgi:5-methyltetrahydrofolate--homocysteine methyltransferase
MGGYDETPEHFAENLVEFAEFGANMLGGCCGTNAEYIKCLAEEVKNIPRRDIPSIKPETMLSGQSEFIFYDHMNFVNVGERCNIAGSLRFKKLIK